MKNLIYSTTSLCFVLLIASCAKNDSIQPQKLSVASQGGCDSAKTVNYVLTNTTGDGSYEIAFSGPQNYTFHFPANGTATVSVKPGNYSVFVYSPGNYSKQNFYWNDQQAINESGARHEDVQITPCTGPQSVKIGQ